MEKNKVEALNCIGFVWQIRMPRKFKSHQALPQNKISHLMINGHCCVPQRYGDDPPDHRRKGLLSAEKVAKLDEINLIGVLDLTMA